MYMSGALGGWWQATKGILQGCPLNVILINLLINLLTTVWKMEIDRMRWHVVVTTAALPPLRKKPGAVPGAPPSPTAAGTRSRQGGCVSAGYLDNTQAITLGPQRGGRSGCPMPRWSWITWLLLTRETHV